MNYHPSFTGLRNTNGVRDVPNRVFLGPSPYVIHEKLMLNHNCSV